MQPQDSGNTAEQRRIDGASREEPLRRFGADVASGAQSAARTAMPLVRRGATRFGDWLASIGWGKFFLLALLALILSAAIGSFLGRRGPAIVIDNADIGDAVKVDVSISPNGIVITPPPKTPKVPAPPKPPKSPAGVSVTSPADDVDVKVDENGIRISGEKDGKKYAVVVDAQGIRVENLPAAAADELPAGKSRDPQSKSRDSGPVKGDLAAKGAVVVAADTSDPEKVAEAIESARDKIEDIVSDQVRRQVARRIRQHEAKDDDWLPGFIMLLIVAAIIVKIVLGSKKKAESRAQAATMTAAEEGLKRQLVEAQLKMMQAQVEPHFLFNTLASVDYLIETDPARASTMQKNLIQYLRAALPQMREGSTTLGKEVALCRAYLEILRVRMEDRLQYAITVPQGLASAQFPPMMLQSLVENAIKHGLEPKAEGGSLTITANISNGNLCVTVADTGRGFGASQQPGTGVGLANVHERLMALYGRTAKLTIEVPYSYDTAAVDSASRQPPAEPPMAPQPA